MDVLDTTEPSPVRQQGDMERALLRKPLFLS